MKRHLAFITAAVLALTTLGGLTGCTSNSPAPAPSGTTTTATPDATPTTVSVVDPTGRTVTLDGPARAIVGLTASDIEIIYALGAGAAVVGRGEYCDYPAEVASVPVVQSGSETNIEQIIALKPDIVFMNTMAQSQEQMDKLAQAGIAVFVSNASTIAETYDVITLMGDLLGAGAQAKAASIVATMTATFTELQADATAKIAGGATPPSIYFEVSPLQYGLWAAGKNTFMDEVATMLQLKNTFADVDGWAAVSEEQVLQRQPDVILTVTMYFGDGPTPVEEIAQRPGWAAVPAVANGKILNLTNNELSRPGPRLTDGAKALYDFVYGA
ncbi:MAG: ABC transporter substrate-binding protein [Propionibacteriaceae bacterium]|jgi:iron complex transport system substrate-binding protein|nr:ABC transporter substrate-binding protein [Propionibacteriaceae bacterium]